MNQCTVNCLSLHICVFLKWPWSLSVAATHANNQNTGNILALCYLYLNCVFSLFAACFVILHVLPSWWRCFPHLIVLFVYFLLFESLKVFFSIWNRLQFRCRCSKCVFYDQVRQVTLSRAIKGCQVYEAPQDDLGWKGTQVCRGLLARWAVQGWREGPSIPPISSHPSSP